VSFCAATARVQEPLPRSSGQGRAKKGNVMNNALLKAYVQVSQLRFDPNAMTHRQAFVYGMTAAMLAFGSSAFAVNPPTGTATGAPLVTGAAGSLSVFLCSVAATLQGPVGIGLVLVAIVVAGIAFAVGGKKSTSILLSALIGGAIIVSARVILGWVAGNSTACGTIT
jgi:type IV secretory pathway VirB2 component (pilin)